MTPVMWLVIAIIIGGEIWRSFKTLALIHTGLLLCVIFSFDFLIIFLFRAWVEIIFMHGFLLSIIYVYIFCFAYVINHTYWFLLFIDLVCLGHEFFLQEDTQSHRTLTNMQLIITTT